MGPRERTSLPGAARPSSEASSSDIPEPFSLGLFLRGVVFGVTGCSGASELGLVFTFPSLVW